MNLMESSGGSFGHVGHIKKSWKLVKLSLDQPCSKTPFKMDIQMESESLQN